MTDTKLFLLILEEGKYPLVKRAFEDNLEQYLIEYRDNHPEKKVLVIRVPTDHIDLWVGTSSNELYQLEVYKDLIKSFEKNKNTSMKILKEIEKNYPKEYRHIKEFLEEVEAPDYEYQVIEFVNEFRGKKYESNDNIWIDEYENGGTEGDSWSGYGYVYLEPEKYVKIPYKL